MPCVCVWCYNPAGISSQLTDNMFPSPLLLSLGAPPSYPVCLHHCIYTNTTKSQRALAQCSCICVMSSILPFKRDFLWSVLCSEGLHKVWSSIIMFLLRMLYMNSLFSLLRLFIPTYFLPITPCKIQQREHAD